MRVGLFASIHNSEILKEYGYSEEKIADIFDDFAPGIICGEVRKVDYEANADYQGPGEYRRYIFDYCQKRNIEFIPCDWFDEETVEANKKLSDIDFGIYNEYADIMEEYMKAGERGEVPFNSEEFNRVVKRKQEFQKRINPEIHNIVWDKRNKAIADNIHDVVIKNPDSDILVVFGAEHIYRLKEELERWGNIELIFPLNKINNR